MMLNVYEERSGIDAEQPAIWKEENEYAGKSALF